jgi:hypothetical protein
MKNKFNMYLAGALMCAAALFTVIACEKDEEKPKPGKAEISVVDETDNNCSTEVEPIVILSVTAENATEYKWYKDGTALSSTGRILNVMVSGTYTAEGVNDQGEGERSDAKIVTIAECGGDDPDDPDGPDQPAPTPDAAGEISGADKNDCAEGETTVTLTIGEIENATSYQWYRGETAIPGATTTVYVVEQTGNYFVEGVNKDLMPGEKSEGKQVTITSCVPAKPNTPQGPGGRTTNNCPQETTLQIYTSYIEGANTVTWYKLEEDESSKSVQSLTKEEEGYLHYDVKASGTYVVQGSNDWNPGPVSESIVVTITECDPLTVVPQGTPVILVWNEAVVDNKYTRDCTLKDVYLNLDNLKNPGSEGIAGGLPITGALSYTWYIYRADAPTTPVELETDYININYSGIQLKVAEGGTYTVVARNDIGPGEESAPVVIEWIACPPAARAITGDTEGCNSKTVELRVTQGQVEYFAGNYYWYKDGEKVGETTSKWTYNVTETGTYKMKVHDDVEGDSDFSNEITVTFSECEGGGDGPVITTVTLDDFSSEEISYKVYDKSDAGFSILENPHNITVKKGAAAGVGDPQIIITGLGGSSFAAGQITGYFKVGNQTITIYGGGGEGEGVIPQLTYNGSEFTVEGNVWISGSRETSNATITATVKKVDGKIYIYIPRVTTDTYVFWSNKGYCSSAVACSDATIFKAVGVDATNYHGEGTATVLVQQ